MKFKEIERDFEAFQKLSKYNDYVDSINKNTIFEKEIFDQMISNTKIIYENENWLQKLVDLIKETNNKCNVK